MRGICKVAAALIALLSFGAPLSAQDNSKLVDLWTIRAFYTEDVQTKARGNIYGEQPTGFIELWQDGSFAAHVQSGPPEPSAQPGLHRSIFYSGTYRVEGSKFYIRVTRVRHEGPVGTDAFDMSWEEGRMPVEEARSFRLSNGAGEVEELSIETAPMVNPNGTENIIVGRIVWARSPD